MVIGSWQQPDKSLQMALCLIYMEPHVGLASHSDRHVCEHSYKDFQTKDLGSMAVSAPLLSLTQAGSQRADPVLFIFS